MVDQMYQSVDIKKGPGQPQWVELLPFCPVASCILPPSLFFFYKFQVGSLSFLGKSHWPRLETPSFLFLYSQTPEQVSAFPTFASSLTFLLEHTASLPLHLGNPAPGFWGVVRQAWGQSLARPPLTSCRPLFALCKPLSGHGGQI